jgi:hypothetical protein
MNRLKKSMVVTLISVATALCPRISSAMDIQMFDAMAVEDQQDYLKYLVKTAQKALVEQGHEDLALQVNQLFRATRSGDHKSLAATQFRELLDRHRAFLAENAGKFSFSSLAGQVEDVFVQTAWNNHITIPNYFSRRLREVVREKPFWPKRPLRTN